MRLPPSNHSFAHQGMTELFHAGLSARCNRGAWSSPPPELASGPLRTFKGAGGITFLGRVNSRRQCYSSRSCEKRAGLRNTCAPMPPQLFSHAAWIVLFNEGGRGVWGIFSRHELYWHSSDHTLSARPKANRVPTSSSCSKTWRGTLQLAWNKITLPRSTWLSFTHFLPQEQKERKIPRALYWWGNDSFLKTNGAVFFFSPKLCVSARVCWLA